MKTGAVRGLSRIRRIIPSSGRAEGHHRQRLAQLSGVSQDPLCKGDVNDQYDVVVVGGGMVGAAVGCGLASAPLTRSLRVAVVDGNPAMKEKYNPRKDAIPDARVSAVTPATVRFLKDVGAWEHVLEHSPAGFDSMQVWDYSGGGFTRYEAADVGEDVLGYVVENNVLVSSLASALQRSEFAEIICPAQVKGVQFPPNRSTATGGLIYSNFENKESSPASKATLSSETASLGTADNSWAHVSLSDGRILQTRLVVGADGGRSRVRDMAGLKTTGWDYNQHALICTVKVADEHSTAWQRFLPSGPLALLPMGGHYSNIVWSTTPKKAKQLKAMSEEEFVREANQALTKDYGPPPSSQFGETIMRSWLSPLLGVISPSAAQPFHVPPVVTMCLTPRLSFPLSLKHANKYVSNGLALVGDAAHTVHPLAGQGVNLGFGDAASLVKTLSEGRRTGADIGEISVLERYEKQRMFANVPMMMALDGFQRIFSTDSPPVKFLRAAGFNVANFVGPLKKGIITYAMGK